MKIRRIIFVAAAVTVLVLAVHFFRQGRQRDEARARTASELARAVPIPAHQPVPFDGKPRNALPAFTGHEQLPPLGEQPSDQEIAGARIFPVQLRPIEREGGAANQAAENAAMASLLRKLRGMGRDGRSAEIERWLAANSDSRWYSALKFQLMVYRHERGFFGDARQGWDELWTKLKDLPDQNAVFLGNEVLARLLESNLGLARSQRLRELVADAEGRSLSGALDARLMRAKEAVWLLEHTGASNVMCGPLALNCIKDYRAERFDPPRLAKISADFIATGIPLSAVADYATNHYKLDLRMAKREGPGVRIPTPAVVHLKDEHYAAILARDSRSGDYFLEDRALGFARWVDAEAIDEMASGYFLVANDREATGWAEVSADEGRNIFGRDGAHGMEEPGKNVTEDSEKTGNEDSPECGNGMPTYVFHPMPGSLRVWDIPVGYTPPVGPDVYFKVNYNDLDSGAPLSAPAFSNVGTTWGTDWVAWVDHVDGELFESYSITVHLPGGGVEESYYDSGKSWFGPNDRSFATIRRSGTHTYTRELPDGSKEIYGAPDDPDFPERVFLTEKVDPSGNSIVFSYDSNLRLVGITDEIGQVTTLQYQHPTDIYKITSVTDPFGRSASLQYNVAGQLTGITDVLNLTSTFTYATNGFIQTMVTPYGTTTFTKLIDTAGSQRVLQVQDPTGDIERIQYIDTGGSPIVPSVFTPPPAVNVGGELVDFYAENERLQFRNSFYWSKKAWAMAPNDYSAARTYRWYTDQNWVVTGILEATKEPFEDRVWYNYPGAAGADEAASNGLACYPGLGGAPEKMLRMLPDGTAQLRQSYYNFMGNLVRTVDPLGRTTDYTYRANGIDLVSMRQTTGGINEVLGSFTYDSRHRPLTATDAAGQKTTFTYNARGQVLTTTNPLGEVVTYGYNSNGYLLTVDGPLAGPSDTVTHTYDAYGRINSIIGVDGYNLTFTYDAFDRLLRTTFPDGTYQENGYNRLDRVTQRDRLGRITTSTYNAKRQLATVTDPLNRTVAYEWCKCGALQGLTDPMGRVTKWQYDAQGRQIAKVYADGSKVTYEYESTIDRMRRKVDEKGQSTVYEYYLDDQLKSVSYPGALVATPSVSYTYDPRYSRMATMTDGIGLTTYVYRPIAGGTLGAGQLASEDGPFPDDTLAYTYDALGRRTSYAVNGVGETLTFDPLGRVIQAVNPLGSFTYNYVGTTERVGSMDYPGGMISTYNYHPLEGDLRLKDITHKLPGGALLSRHSYEYDSCGNITRWTQNHPSVGLNRLWQIGYDAADQLLSVVSKDPSTLASLPAGQYNYAYDASGNRIMESVDGVVVVASYDYLNQIKNRSGDSAIVGNIEFEWNANNRIVAIHEGDRRSEFSYDGKGLRRIVTEKQNNVVISQKSLIWDSLSLLEERNLGSSAVVARYLDQGMQAISGSNLLTYLVARDHLGSGRSLVSTDGAVDSVMDFDPWGRSAVLQGARRSFLGFAGHLNHEQSEMVLAPYRSYNPQQGRWISRDPLGESEGFNVYSYVLNNPAGYIDPTGLRLWYGDRESDAALRKHVKKIMKTKKGRELLSKLHGDPCNTYRIYARSGPDSEGPYQLGNDVYVDPAFTTDIQTNKGMKKASTTRILAHELGHLTGTSDDGSNRMNNVNEWENPIMSPLEGYRRTRY